MPAKCPRAELRLQCNPKLLDARAKERVEIYESPAVSLSLSQAALNVLTRTAGEMLSSRQCGGIWVGAVCPGDVDTAMCSVDRAEAADARQAAQAVLWVAQQSGLDSEWQLPSGRFWRNRTIIPF